MDVLGTELLAVLEVVPHEVLRQRPVRAVRPHRGLPHVPVRVDHAGHHDAAGGVDLLRPLRDVESRTDRFDPITDEEDVGVLVNGVPVVHREHGAATQDQRPGLGHECLRTDVRIAVTPDLRHCGLGLPGLSRVA
jgi:hypothetical protein